MLIGVAHRFVLLTSPYTGSGPLERWLTPYAEINRVGSDRRQHLSWQEMVREYHFLFGQKPWSLDTFYTWGLLRAPVDWVWTAYRQWLRANPPGGRIPMDADAAFRHWWAEDPLNLRQQPQFARFLGWDGKCSLNAVVPAPLVGQVVPRVLARLGLPIPSDGMAGKVARGQVAVPEDLARDIRHHFRQDEAWYQQWMAHWSASEPVAHQLEIEVALCEGVEEARLVPPKSVAPPEQVQPHLHGVVVMRRSHVGPVVLRLEGSPGLQGEVHGQLPSPWMASRYPDHPQAPHARLEIRGLCLKSGQSARIVLVSAGTSQTLFHLRLVGPA